MTTVVHFSVTSLPANSQSKTRSFDSRLVMVWPAFYHTAPPLGQ